MLVLTNVQLHSHVGECFLVDTHSTAQIIVDCVDLWNDGKPVFMHKNGTKQYLGSGRHFSSNYRNWCVSRSSHGTIDVSQVRSYVVRLMQFF
jgi:hypothetical protein